MKTVQLTPEQMNEHIVRFKSLKPRSLIAQASTRIPAEVAQALAADSNFSYMSPVLPNNSTITAHSAIRGGDAGDCISLSMAICKPGRGPQLHAHARTCESFFCLKGTFTIKWGDKGEQQTLLEPYDFIAVPAGVVRTFINESDEEAHLLVIIQGNRIDFQDVYFVPEVAEMIVQRFGLEAKEKLEASGRRFTAGVPEVAAQDS
jgi:mannose-6-phosphate isomerase-like protein (cupin superfamily)